MTKIVMIVLFTVTLVACNTVRGVGQDVEKGGEAIQKTTQ